MSVLQEPYLMQEEEVRGEPGDLLPLQEEGHAGAVEAGESQAEMCRYSQGDSKKHDESRKQ